MQIPLNGPNRDKVREILATKLQLEEDLGEDEIELELSKLMGKRMSQESFLGDPSLL